MRGDREERGGHRLEAAQALSRTLLEVESTEAVAEEAVRHIRAFLDCSHISVVVFDSEAAQATVVASFSSTAAKGGGGSRWAIDAFGSLDGAPGGGPRFVPDLLEMASLPPAIGALARSGARSMIGVPLTVGNERIGAILVGAAQPNAFELLDLELLSSSGELFAQAIRRARRVERLLEQAVALGHRVEELERGRADHRSLMSAVALAQEQERQRIAIDIHDDSVQVMTTAALRLHALRKEIGVGRLQELAGEIEDTIRLAVRRLRHLMFELIPAALDRDGLGPALSIYLHRVGESYGIGARVENRLSRQPPADVRVILYRVAQEAIMNVVKHARASEISMVVEEREGGFAIEVGDNGVGFSIEDIESRLPMHLGLTAMRQRAEMAGGWCRIHSLAGSGTRVEAWVPGEALRAEPDAGRRASSA
ncbi:MAG: GAF domain-containing sensor histidine kinase [Actinomycetota bacterium]